MTDQRQNRKSTIVMSILLSIALIATGVLTYLYINVDAQLKQRNNELIGMTTLQENTATALATTEASLAETQATLADMTAKQETTAATLATIEATLAETQAALSDMTTKQETTAATLAKTESTLAETRAALSDMTAQQETTTATLASTEATLAETQAALSDMTAQQETTAATLVTTEAALTKTQTALADMTTQKEATAAMLATAEASLIETQATLETVLEENNRLQVALQSDDSKPGVVGEIDTTDIALSSTTDTEFVVLKEIAWETYGFHHLALIIENTSGKSKQVSAQVLFYNEDGRLVGASNSEQYVCGNGEEAFLYCTCENAYASYEYSIELSDGFVQSNNSTIEISSTINPSNIIIMAKNTGTSSPEFIEYHCLFYSKDGTVVGSDWGYMDSPAPGKATFIEINPYTGFERVEVYYSAYSFGF